ncbi:hypothetical protein HK101_005220, partial [Irineochytrium annulatum]
VIDAESALAPLQADLLSQKRKVVTSTHDAAQATVKLQKCETELHQHRADLKNERQTTATLNERVLTLNRRLERAQGAIEALQASVEEERERRSNIAVPKDVKEMAVQTEAMSNSGLGVLGGTPKRVSAFQRRTARSFQKIGADGLLGETPSHSAHQKEKKETSPFTFVVPDAAGAGLRTARSTSETTPEKAGVGKTPEKEKGAMAFPLPQFTVPAKGSFGIRHSPGSNSNSNSGGTSTAAVSAAPSPPAELVDLADKPSTSAVDKIPRETRDVRQRRRESARMSAIRHFRANFSVRVRAKVVALTEGLRGRERVLEGLEERARVLREAAEERLVLACKLTEGPVKRVRRIKEEVSDEEERRREEVKVGNVEGLQVLDKMFESPPPLTSPDLTFRAPSSRTMGLTELASSIRGVRLSRRIVLQLVAFVVLASLLAWHGLGLDLDFSNLADYAADTARGARARTEDDSAESTRNKLQQAIGLLWDPTETDGCVQMLQHLNRSATVSFGEPPPKVNAKGIPNAIHFVSADSVFPTLEFMCPIESAIRMNPNHRISVYVPDPSAFTNLLSTSSEDLNYINVASESMEMMHRRVRIRDFDRILRDTPLEPLESLLDAGDTNAELVVTLVTLAVLWREGGVVMGNDV